MESLLNRRFYPEIRTQAFDWPDPLGTTSLPFTVYFDRHDVLSITTLTSGSQIVPGDYFLLPDDGPPFTRLELDAEGSASFDQNSAGQRSIRSEEHPSELQSLMRISYAVVCLKKKT